MLRPRLIAITDTTVVEPDVLVERLGALCVAAAPGSVMLQLRDPELPARPRLALGRCLVEIAHQSEQLFAVNDRMDLALLLDADALHLGERSVEPAESRRLVGAEVWISRACHGTARSGTPAGTKALVQAPGADAIVVSPVMASRKGNPALGTHGIEQARRVVGGPPPLLYALGGVSAGNAAECLRAGADGVAAIGAVLRVDDPVPLLEALGIRR